MTTKTTYWLNCGWCGMPLEDPDLTISTQYGLCHDDCAGEMPDACKDCGEDKDDPEHLYCSDCQEEHELEAAIAEGDAQVEGEPAHRIAHVVAWKDATPEARKQFIHGFNAGQPGRDFEVHGATDEENDKINDAAPFVLGQRRGVLYILPCGGTVDVSVKVEPAFPVGQDVKLMTVI